MKNMCVIDSKGNWIGSVLKEDNFEETEDIKNTFVGYFLKPKWSFEENRWIETATDEEINPPNTDEELSDVQQLAQALTELELDNFEKDNRINELEKENQLLGQESTDHDLRLIELEEKLNV